mmetsp:Transcript_7209/g.16439  ORF Transcript_7209/g.16439 Transcript_7209/m.16439 type:complete len:358 (+) Transcript_7209:2-1075(+)
MNPMKPSLIAVFLAGCLLLVASDDIHNEVLTNKKTAMEQSTPGNIDVDSVRALNEAQAPETEQSLKGGDSMPALKESVYSGEPVEDFYGDDGIKCSGSDDVQPAALCRRRTASEQSSSASPDIDSIRAMNEHSDPDSEQSIPHPADAEEPDSFPSLKEQDGPFKSDIHHDDSVVIDQLQEVEEELEMPVPKQTQMEQSVEEGQAAEDAEPHQTMSLRTPVDADSEQSLPVLDPADEDDGETMRLLRQVDQELADSPFDGSVTHLPEETLPGAEAPALKQSAHEGSLPHDCTGDDCNDPEGENLSGDATMSLRHPTEADAEQSYPAIDPADPAHGDVHSLPSLSKAAEEQPHPAKEEL